MEIDIEPTLIVLLRERQYSSCRRRRSGAGPGIDQPSSAGSWLRAFIVSHGSATTQTEKNIIIPRPAWVTTLRSATGDSSPRPPDPA